MTKQIKKISTRDNSLQLRDVDCAQPGNLLIAPGTFQNTNPFTFPFGIFFQRSFHNNGPLRTSTHALVAAEICLLRLTTGTCTVRYATIE